MTFGYPKRVDPPPATEEGDDSEGPKPPRPPPELGQILFKDADFGVDLETRIGKKIYATIQLRLGSWCKLTWVLTPLRSPTQVLWAPMVPVNPHF